MHISEFMTRSDEDIRDYVADLRRRADGLRAVRTGSASNRTTIGWLAREANAIEHLLEFRTLWESDARNNEFTITFRVTRRDTNPKPKVTFHDD